MKGKLWKIAAVLLALLMLCSACAGSVQKQSTPDENKEQSPVTQEARIAQLEAELATLQQKESSYKAQIAALEARVAQLSAPEDAPSMAERVTFYYRAENGGAVITGYSGDVALLTVPATLDGLPVIAIGEHAFERATLTAVILPDGITEIGWFAFYECEGLSGITIPPSVSSIGYAVFDGCPSLTVRCAPHSYAEQYAKSYAIPYVNS
jgi:hypothetical protein